MLDQNKMLDAIAWSHMVMVFRASISMCLLKGKVFLKISSLSKGWTHLSTQNTENQLCPDVVSVTLCFDLASQKSSNKRSRCDLTAVKITRRQFWPYKLLTTLNSCTNSVKRIASNGMLLVHHV